MIQHTCNYTFGAFIDCCTDKGPADKHQHKSPDTVSIVSAARKTHSIRCQEIQIRAVVSVATMNGNLYSNCGCKNPRQPISSTPPPIIRTGYAIIIQYHGVLFRFPYNTATVIAAIQNNNKIPHAFFRSGVLMISAMKSLTDEIMW